jgi:PncC family amidohydrolase
MDRDVPTGITEEDALASAVGDALIARGERVAVAETTAGGLISARLLSVPGASAWFDRGVVCYGGRSKQELTGADGDLLRRAGSVSTDAVAAMAEGMRTVDGVAWAVAESGIAGPQGSRRSPKPAGSVTIAVAGPHDVLRVVEEVLPGSRVDVMRGIAQRALVLLLEELQAAG